MLRLTTLHDSGTAGTRIRSGQTRAIRASPCQAVPDGASACQREPEASPGPRRGLSFTLTPWWKPRAKGSGARSGTTLAFVPQQWWLCHVEEPKVRRAEAGNRASDTGE